MSMPICLCPAGSYAHAHAHAHAHAPACALQGPTGSLLHDSRLMPMLIPPVPWTSFDSGGMVMHGPSAVRASKRSMFVQAEKAGQMDQLYRGLNTLNAQPWCVQACCGFSMLHRFAQGCLWQPLQSSESGPLTAQPAISGPQCSSVSEATFLRDKIANMSWKG
eukprot:1133462-Pelagomonas_calceolata.AAC.1